MPLLRTLLADCDGWPDGEPCRERIVLEAEDPAEFGQLRAAGWTWASYDQRTFCPACTARGAGEVVTAPHGPPRVITRD
jgi:hypothetical protein